MQEYKTKNSVFNSILQGVVVNLEKREIDHVETKVFDHLSTKVSSYHGSIENNISVPEVETFSNFWMEIKEKSTVSSIEWKRYLTLLYNALNGIDCHIIDNIKQLVNKIIDHKKSLNPSCDAKYLTAWFQTFSIDLKQLMTLLHKRSAVISKKVNQDILLYNVQLSTCVKFLFDIFRTEFSHDIVLSESRNFISKRFDTILSGIQDALLDEIDKELNPGFIQWMDNTLDLLSMINPDIKNDEKDLENIKTALDEVLCHAMSVTQISSEEDRKKIVASIQSVLREFKQLKIELENDKINPSSINLSLDLVSDKLFLLEKRINNSVLNISLNVFSDPNKPLQTLKSYCEGSNNTIFNRSLGDLDSMINFYDSQVESIIQVGLFAIACSTNKKTIAQIRSGLASLEVLETELIPALTTLYLEPSELHCLYSQLLAKHWIAEVEMLRDNICYIIEPMALSQVLLEEYKKWLEVLQEAISTENYVLNDSEIKKMLKKVNVLILVVDATIKDMKEVDENITKHFTNLKLVQKEIHSALKILPKDDKKSIDRINKRLHILSTMIFRIGLAFTEDPNNSLALKHSENNQEDEINTKSTTSNLQKLKVRGVELLKNRSVLYKTPIKPSLKLFNTPKNTTRFIRTFEARKLGLSFVKKQMPELQENESLDLHITEILEELTNLTDTLSG